MKRWVIVGAVVGLGAVGLLVGLMAKKDSPEQQQKPQASLETFREPQVEFEFSYDKAQTSVQQLSEQDTKERIVFRATETTNGQKPFLVTARYEKGLRTVSSISKVEPLDIILDGAERTLPQKFPEFHKVSSTKFDQHGDKAAELVYTYKGPTGETIKQKLYVLVNDGDVAAYITTQSREADYESLNDAFFKQITQSLKYP